MEVIIGTMADWNKGANIGFDGISDNVFNNKLGFFVEDGVGFYDVDAIVKRIGSYYTNEALLEEFGISEQELLDIQAENIKRGF